MPRGRIHGRDNPYVDNEIKQYTSGRHSHAASWKIDIERDTVDQLGHEIGYVYPTSRRGLGDISAPVQTGPGVHPASYTVGTRPISRV